MFPAPRFWHLGEIYLPILKRGLSLILSPSFLRWGSIFGLFLCHKKCLAVTLQTAWAYSWAHNTGFDVSRVSPIMGCFMNLFYYGFYLLLRKEDNFLFIDFPIIARLLELPFLHPLLVRGRMFWVKLRQVYCWYQGHSLFSFCCLFCYFISYPLSFCCGCVFSQVFRTVYPSYLSRVKDGL